MIRWCSYCNSFLGQIEPYEDYRISHGLCESCLQSFSAGTIAINREVVAFYEGLFEDALQAEPIGVDAVLHQAAELQLPRGDLLLGVLHPLLCRIGAEYQAGRLSIEQEHLFSSAVNGVLQFFSDDSNGMPSPVVLFPARHNEHTIGMKFVHHVLRDRSHLRSVVIPTPTDADELLAVLGGYRPKLLGISVALPQQVSYVREVADWLAAVECELRPRIVVGGPAVPDLVGGDDRFLPEGVEICDPHDVDSFLNRVAQLV